MARRRYGRRRGGGRSFKIPVITLAALGTPLVLAGYKYKNTRSIGAAVGSYFGSYTGYDPYAGDFQAGRLVQGLGPVAAAFGVKILTRMARLRSPKWLPISLS